MSGDCDICGSYEHVEGNCDSIPLCNDYEIVNMLSGTYPRDLKAEIQLDLMAVERLINNIREKIKQLENEK